jgi:uncharacterized protein YpuA (DUF1002 family)
MSEKRENSDEQEFTDRVVGNPIHAYKMMKRFSVDWKKIENDLKEDDWTGIDLEKKENIFYKKEGERALEDRNRGLETKGNNNNIDGDWSFLIRSQ